MVRIHYTCTLANGTVIDSSNGKDPLEFTVGEAEIIQGLEDAVLSMKVGQEKVVTVAAENAYGIRHEEWTINVGRDKLPPEFKAEVGLRYEIPREGGQSSQATVTRVSESTVTLDFNKAYNPYCAYSGKWSCPVPPEENHLETEIKAGVKKYH